MKALAGIAAVTLLLASTTARAESFAQCAAAAERGQTSRDEREFSKARAQFLQCSVASCPETIRRDCLGWLDAVERAMPSAVFYATAGADRDLTDVRVEIDGFAITDRLDGRSQFVEPGMHRVRFVWNGASRESQVVFVEGEKNRKVEARFDPPAADRPARRSSPWPWVASGVALVGAAGFIGFGLSGKADVDELGRCEPRCATDDVAAARAKYIAADVSLGVGIVALGVATYLFLTERAARPTPTTASTSVGPAVRFAGP